MFSFSVVPKDLSYNLHQGVSDARAPPNPPSSSSRGVSPTPCSSRRGSPTPCSPQSPLSLPTPISSLPMVVATIMVVDDELLNRMVLLTKLRQCEERVRERLGTAGRGLAACQFSIEIEQAEHAEMGLVVMHDMIEARQKQKAKDFVQIDIIILDEHMESSGGILKGKQNCRCRQLCPGPNPHEMTGTEAMTHFRQLAQKHGAKQPVIVLSSGNCSPIDQQRYTDMGADVTWRKPYPTGDLVVESLVEWVIQDCKSSVVQIGRAV
jgi:CheY-like chemotaxis protein